MTNLSFKLVPNLCFLYVYAKGRISSVGRALDCRTGGHGFDSRGWTNTESLIITEK